MQLGGREVRDFVGDPAIGHFKVSDEALPVERLRFSGVEERERTDQKRKNAAVSQHTGV